MNWFSTLVIIILVLLGLALLHIIISSPYVQSISNKFIKGLEKSNPEVANFLEKLGFVIYKVSEIAYSIIKPVIDMLYSLLSGTETQTVSSAM